MKRYTILKTQTATIGKRYVNVETVHLNHGRQDIAYLVNGKMVTSDEFWAMKPKFISEN
jgi:hypothetical protein